MFWVILLIVIAAFLCWLLFSPFEIEIDTRIARAALRWISIGNAYIWYENEWWLSFQILFYHKTIRFSEIKLKPKKITGDKTRQKPKRKMKMSRLLKISLRVIKTFRVKEWQLAIDTGDNVRNAQLYPLNFMRFAGNHLHINFMDENYFRLKVRNRPWKILYAFLR
jgi:hypothetical protein